MRGQESEGYSPLRPLPPEGRDIVHVPIILERDADGWYVATAPTLPGCHTQGRSIDEAVERIREAILLSLAEGSPLLEFVGILTLDVRGPGR